ncbi:TRAP transporter small permease subunit [Paracoccus sp. (in: a-proteobacteria)]|uniref:TRAP transporter small permease subunit n=1 Tax=Paracoccus sp. TaxID=267 RepID=UPI003A8B6277
MTIDKDGAGTERHLSRDDAEKLLHRRTGLPQTFASQRIDGFVIAFGKAASWLWLVVIGIIMWAVIGRYAFARGSVTLEEWQWHVAGAAWLIGLGYTLAADEHVRVDVLHERFRPATQAWIEFLGITLLLFPFLAFALYEAIPIAVSSFHQGERSPAPAGLANRWILKAIMSLSFALLLAAGLSRLLRVTAFLFGFPKPIARTEAR